ncbi:MAG: hypothetical protein JRI26_08230 [Deltaproteobacteria bacterium]|nr:hypothetical protein [Deltaproteobacteria bacterium]
MLRKIGLISLIVFLGGCAGSPARIGMMSPEEVQAENSYNLCNAYAFSKSENAKAELIRRNAIPDDEWPVIEQKKIRMGMSELGLVCSWGYPSTINKTVTRYGERKQWVYRSCSSCKGQYVYTENGKVTSWQN